MHCSRTFVRMAAHMQDACSYSDASSVDTLESRMHAGSPKPCCFHPDAHFKLLSDDGQVLLAPASMLHQGARVQSASGKVVEVVNPPEQHQVDSVIELKAGTASLVVSPDHRVARLLATKTVKSRRVVGRRRGDSGWNSCPTQLVRAQDWEDGGDPPWLQTRSACCRICQICFSCFIFFEDRCSMEQYCLYVSELAWRPPCAESTTALLAAQAMRC